MAKMQREFSALRELQSIAHYSMDLYAKLFVHSSRQLRRRVHGFESQRRAEATTWTTLSMADIEMPDWPLALTQCVASVKAATMFAKQKTKVETFVKNLLPVGSEQTFHDWAFFRYCHVNNFLVRSASTRTPRTCSFVEAAFTAVGSDDVLKYYGSVEVFVSVHVGATIGGVRRLLNLAFACVK